MTMTARQFTQAAAPLGQAQVRLEDIGVCTAPTGVLPSGHTWILTDYRGCLPAAGEPMPDHLLLGIYEPGDAAVTDDDCEEGCDFSEPAFHHLTAGQALDLLYG